MFSYLVFFLYIFLLVCIFYLFKFDFQKSKYFSKQKIWGLENYWEDSSSFFLSVNRTTLQPPSLLFLFSLDSRSSCKHWIEISNICRRHSDAQVSKWDWYSVTRVGLGSWTVIRVALPTPNHGLALLSCLSITELMISVNLIDVGRGPIVGPRRAISHTDHTSTMMFCKKLKTNTLVKRNLKSQI